MPKQKKEINIFNNGIILNADEQDIPINAAAFSLNVDPITENGILAGINANKLTHVIDGLSSRVCFPLIFSQNGESLNGVDAPKINTDIFCIEDVDTMKNSELISFIGTKGYRETLQVSSIVPHMERLIVNQSHLGNSTTTTYGVIDFNSALSTTDTEFPTNGSGSTTDPSALVSYIEVGDYLQFNSTTTFKDIRNYEIVKVLSVDVSNNTITLKRGALGSIPQSYSDSQAYNVFINKISYNKKGIQSRTGLGYLNAFSWGDIGGNHLKGNDYLQQAQTNSKHAVTGASDQVVFDADSKSMTISGTNNLNYALQVGDYLTIYTTAHGNSSNHGSTFKVHGIDSANNTYYFTTAPVSETVTTSTTFYFEPGLIKNPSFFHKSASSGVGDDQIYKVNDWYLTERGPSNILANAPNESADTGAIVQASGNIYTDTNLFGSDLSATYYPYSAKKLTLVSKFMKLGFASTISDFGTADTLLTTTDHATSSLMEFGYASGDILYIDNDSDGSSPTEYLKVKNVSSKGLSVTRGIYGTSIANHSGTNYVYKSVGYEINQDIDKDSLKHDTEYELTFWAKIDTATAATTTLTCVHDTRSNYDGKTFDLVSSAGTIKTYIYDDDNEGATGTTDSSGYIRIQLHGLADDNDVIAEQTRLAIINANGHNGEITASRTDNALALAQAYSGESGNTEVTTTADVAHFTCPAFSGGTSPEGTFAIEVNGGYFNGSGDWVPYSQETVNVGYEQDYNTPARTFRYNTFISCRDTRRIDSMENRIIDNIKWRQLSYRFKTPKGELKTDMKLIFGNVGPKDSQISICNINLSEEAIIYNANKDAGFLSSTGFIDSNKIKTLIGFDSSNSRLRIFEDFSSDNINTNAQLEISSSTTDLINSSNNYASFVNKNKSVHIGYGGSSPDTSPQWLGYINRTIFNEENNGLYLDNDVVGSYDTIGTSNIDKVCLAGEFECVSAEWLQSNETLTVDMGSGNEHHLNAGDNIIIREYLDTANAWDGSGVWYVSALDNAAGDDSTRYFRCTRNETFDPLPSVVSTNKIFDLDKNGVKDSSTGKISFRPYYYYGIKRGEPYIYRIFPDTRLKANTGTLSNDIDAEYTKGRMERCGILEFNINSICCSYAKNTNSGAIGVDGGHIYALADSNDRIYRINVMAKYNEWTTVGFAITEIIDMEYRSFKWSNLRTDGNIGASEYVFDSSSLVSSPIIEANGIPSDIIETKGPASSFDWADSDDNDAADVTPDNMDNRLWIQFHPGENSTFTDGDRFLFCSRSTYLTGANTVQFADRTPPTVTRYPKSLTFMFSQETDSEDDTTTFLSGFDCDTGRIDWDNTEGVEPEIRNARAIGGLSNVIDYNFVSNLPDMRRNSRANSTYPYTEHGNNLGWDGSDGTPSSIYLAKYGLFQIADNDGDGLLDGTGVVIPNASSINTSALPYKPYGEIGRKMSSHAVGLIGGSSKPWIKKAGKTFISRYTESSHGSGDAHIGTIMANTSAGQRAYKRWQQLEGHDTPEFMNAEKCVFVCTDMHFGDVPQHEYYDISAIGASENFGNSADHHTQITTSEAHGLQAGDLVYFDGTGGWPGWGNSYYITSVESSTIFHVTVVHGGVYTGSGKAYVGGFQRNRYVQLNNLPGNLQEHISARGYTRSGGNDKSFHFAFNTTDKANGSIFNEHGGFGRLWYTDQNIHGIDDGQSDASSYPNTGNINGYKADREGIFPPISHMVEQLNWQAGFMIRPFDMDDEGFQDLLIGNGISVDMPCFPDAIYHTGNHVKTDVGTGVGNLKASRLFISSETPADEFSGLSKSKIYICDWSTLVSNDSSRVSLNSVNTSGWGFSGGFPDSIDASRHTPTFKPYFWGQVKNESSTSYVSTAANTDYLRDATYHPIINVKMANINSLLGGYNTTTSWYMQSNKRNALAGLCITVIDQTNGYVQTRKIIGNIALGTHPMNDTMRISIHYPFSKTPVDDDRFYIWNSADVATAPVRLLKEINVNETLSTTFDYLSGVLPKINQKDHIIEREFFKGAHIGRFTAASSGTTATFTLNDSEVTSGVVDIRAGETVTIEAGSSTNELYNGTYLITGSPTTTSFTVTTVASDIENINNPWPQYVEAYYTGENMRTMNPIITKLGTPSIKMNYGDLDMRKLKPLTVTSISGHHETNPDVAQLTTTANHLLSAGDYITLQEASSDTDFVGNYIIKSVADGATKIDIYHDDSSDPVTDDYNLIQNQWGGIGVAKTGSSYIGEIRSALTEWDTGEAFANNLRADVTTEDVASQYMRVEETSVTIQSSSIEDTSGFFKKGVEYLYRISLIYDGYQEGPLSRSSFLYKQNTTVNETTVKISVTDFSKRLTHVCIYRSDDGGFYRLVREIPVNTGWTKETGKMSYNLSDKGDSGGSYESRTGISEVMSNLSVKYGLSCESEGYLFAGDCSHINIKDASNQIFRSKPGKWSIFDWASDFVVLNSTPTALISFAGKLIAFDKNNLYRINPHSLVIEDIFEGIGCSGPNSVIVTEYSMFFANRQGAYMYDAQKPVKISSSIQKGGGSNMLSLSNSSILGTNEIHDLSWDNTAGNIQTKEPAVVFDSKANLVYFIVEYFNPEDITYSSPGGVSSRYKVNKKRSYIWSFSFEKERWDLWELSNNDDIVGAPFTNENGDVFVSIGNGLFHLKGSPNKLLYSWLSKKLVMDTSLINKVFNKVKIIGPRNNLIIDGGHKNDSDKLIVATDTGRITSGSNSTSSNITYKSDGTNSADYKLGGSNKRGKWLQVLLEDMDEEVEATAIIYRMRAIK